ncbi:MAG TPA: Holliday junction resolvase RuvX [Thermodesulfobacteriota bacterium]|nr:Holliday junction resolvase RuvX [Thermodesulfobacteriota bacterium]
MRIIGLDVGEKRTGVAISDESALIAQPLKVIERKSGEKVIEEILKIADSYGADEIVIGVPYNMDGSVGKAARGVLKLASLLKEKTGLKIIEWDERLSTVAIEKVLISADVSRKKRKGVVDKLAAAYILQGYLEARKNPI